MTLWLRELAGWLLVAWGALLLFEAVGKISDSLIFEAGPLTVIGIIVFRGGIHLLKVAVATRVCSLAKERSRPEPARAPARPTVRPVVAGRAR